MPEMKEPFESWGVIEVLGHLRLAGLVSEQVIAGVAMVRVDIPKTQSRDAYTRYFGAASIYGITPTSEETARFNAENIERYSSPVPYAPPKQLRAGEDVVVPGLPDDYALYDDELDEQLGLHDSGETPR